MSKTIEIIISPDGSTRLQTKGFVGSSCQKASKLLEQALGQILTDEKTAESYLTQDQAMRQRTTL